MVPLAVEASELKLGMSNEQVKELQDLLKAKGFFAYHTSTGYFGPVTEKAVKEFQASVHLTPTGIVDKATYEKLKSSVSTHQPGNVLKMGAKGESVSVLQRNLKTLGYFTYPKITGYYGSVTAEAVKRFQQAYGLKADGVVDSQTLQKIQEAVQRKNKPQAASKQNENGTNSSPVLKLGTRGKEVSQLQLHLKTLGYFQYPTITDYYGSATSDAVRKFQKENGLKVTGIADSITLAKIRQAIEQKEKSQAAAPKRDVYLAIGSIGEQVKQVQMKLKQLGYFTYPTITGYYGSVTAEAVKQFQKSVQLPATGTVDSQTYELLMDKEANKTFDVMDLIADAAELLGIPYVWGGETPETGFDCSGFLVYVFKKQGISLPRTVATIWNAGKPVNAPSVGDIVFFETYQPGASHAGIYIGNNQFIHSGGTNGVSISRLDSPYWSQRYLGAKRYY
ncbi:C40 family peptidase [Paranoxybacillus vitaminiphilus]|nr:peptidoglycan-binding protein [Anoxybacillus vitaminiphilus]